MQSVRIFSPARGLVSNYLKSNTTCTSQRFFSWTSTCQNDENKETPEAVTEQVVEEETAEPIKLSRRRRRFHEWVNGAGAKFSRPSRGTTNYLGETPFPNNPLFKPRPPLSDAIRQQIYDSYINDPENWTVRQLATKYNISLKRVEAVLKLKASEKEMEMNGIALQTKFNKGMEQLMGVDQNTLFKEPLIDIFPPVGKPRFKTLPEDATYTPRDAAKTLGRTPFKDLEKRMIEAEAEFTLPTSYNADNKATTKGTKFVIVDTSS